MLIDSILMNEFCHSRLAQFYSHNSRQHRIKSWQVSLPVRCSICYLLTTVFSQYNIAIDYKK